MLVSLFVPRAKYLVRFRLNLMLLKFGSEFNIALDGPRRTLLYTNIRSVSQFQLLVNDATEAYFQILTNSTQACRTEGIQ